MKDKILNAEEIAYKYVHGEHDAFTQSQEKKDMTADIIAFAENYKEIHKSSNTCNCGVDLRRDKQEIGIDDEDGSYLDLSFYFCPKCGVVSDVDFS